MDRPLSAFLLVPRGLKIRISFGASHFEKDLPCFTSWIVLEGAQRFNLATQPAKSRLEVEAELQSTQLFIVSNCSVGLSSALFAIVFATRL